MVNVLVCTTKKSCKSQRRSTTQRGMRRTIFFEIWWHLFGCCGYQTWRHSWKKKSSYFNLDTLCKSRAKINWLIDITYFIPPGFKSPNPPLHPLTSDVGRFTQCSSRSRAKKQFMIYPKIQRLLNIEFRNVKKKKVYGSWLTGFLNMLLYF